MSLYEEESSFFISTSTYDYNRFIVHAAKRRFNEENVMWKIGNLSNKTKVFSKRLCNSCTLRTNL